MADYIASVMTPPDAVFVLGEKTVDTPTISSGVGLIAETSVSSVTILTIASRVTIKGGDYLQSAGTDFSLINGTAATTRITINDGSITGNVLLVAGNDRFRERRHPLTTLRPAHAVRSLP